jgi:ribose/xylose/arabinose/galactoside ABC-type transport system permease subunit
MQVAAEDRVTSWQGASRRWKGWADARPNFTSLATTLLLLVALILIFYGINERFLSWRNIVIILNQSAAYVILGVGMTFVITTRGIDLSIGAIVALVGTVLGLVLVTWQLPVWLALVAALATGALCGLFNGLWVARFLVPPLIVTLGTMALFRGIAYVALGHQILFGYPEAFLWIARARIFGLSPAVYIAIAVVIWGYFFLNKTRTGQHITAVGGNEEAARLAGIDVARTRFIVYFIMGVLSALAAMVWVARLNSAQAALAYGVEFHTIALVVLGGTSLFGGRGLIMGSVMGALILGVLENGLVIVGLSSFVQQVVIGLIFIAVVAFRTLQFREGQVTR